MKRIIAALAGITLVAGAGLWWTTRHHPSGSLLDEPARPFLVEAAQPGWSVRFVDARIALRSLRWICPRQEGILAAQVLTQNDRQMLSVFRAGADPVDLAVARPQGVSEAFWRFALLQEAYVAPSGAVVLLYRAGEAGSTEPSLVLALDPGALEARWVHRGSYEHMAVGGETDPGVFLYGSQGPVLRLPLAGVSRRPVARTIELPAEIPAVDDLLPTGSWTFLATSRSGLSAYMGSKGWSHFPAPGDRGVPCEAWRTTLARHGRRFWWQPAPGKVVQVAQDGTLVADREITGLPAGDPLARDVGLMRLLGADASGRLWFALASPSPQAPPEDASTPAADWPAYAAAQGLGRIYRWNPDKETLERLVWDQALAGFRAPFQVPGTVPVLDPAAGSLLLEGNRAAWWFPLGALPFRACGDQAR